MIELNIIDEVINKLRKYPDIKFDRNSDRELKIYSHDKKGFDILLQAGKRENTLSFGTFHWHFDNIEDETDKLLNQLALCLTGMARIKAFSKNGKAYKWVLQLQDNGGNWFDNGTMGLLNINFWTKADIKYLQNNLLPKEILVDNDSHTFPTFWKRTTRK